MGTDGYFDVWSDFYGTPEEPGKEVPVIPQDYFAALMNARRREHEEEQYLQQHYREYID